MSLRIKVNIPSGLKNAGHIIGEEFKTAMNQTTSEIEQDAKSNARRVTGNMSRAISSDVVPIGNNVRGIVYVNTQQAPYGPMVEYGTGIYSEAPGAPKQRITPKNGKALAFMLNRGESRPTTPEGWRAAIADGRAIIVKSIAGSRPQPYMRPAFDKAKDMAQKNYSAAVERAKGRMSQE